MSKPEILEKTPVTLAELKSELNSTKKSDETPSFRVQKTIEYVNSFSVLSKTAASDLKKKLEELNIPRLKEEHIVKIIDVLPKSAIELGVLLQAYTITISKENMNSIAELVKEHAK